jgi:HAD superfamily phosphoserine phosphatase-like hydrolase
VRSVAGDDTWDRFEVELAAGRITLRGVLAAEAAMIRMTEPEALAFLEAHATVDPTFGTFVRRAKMQGATVEVVSSGLRQIIEPALARSGVEVTVHANDVTFDPNGWTLDFIDDSLNGHDKAGRVRAAAAGGRPTVYIGDGVSDFEAAMAADRCFAKSGRALEAYCQERGVAFMPFTSFAEIERELFA